ncbi:Cytochrome c family protein [hydrothermal vent metagenome]|uniref:Cytochrome c family protein n=1 Tax=hydrothermal vent metagenome TaxID=652676 RepID=A0A3B1BQF9_9ZZZZ
MNIQITNRKTMLAGAVIALGILSVNVATAGVSVTKHNLGSTGTGTNTFDGTQAICVFCHTPHGADNSASVPLWNRVLPSSSAYTTYDSLGTTSLDGAVAPVGSVSIACLSCHDGTQAMNVMINAPGSGGYDPAGSALAGTWTGPAGTASPVGSLNYATGSIVNIGTDLSNDHPVGIQYGGGGATSADADGVFGGAMADPDFIPPYKATINTKAVWWVDTTIGTGGIREKTDMQLYTRADLGATEPFVECASCHNPHTSDNPTFLRIANTGSAVCLACHTK